MVRNKIPKEIETKVLINSRRRCCLCYGLNKDTEIKQGQIAHLNKNKNDNRLENLVFLCLEHHDTFDSITSQSKNITRNEIIHYKKELYYEIDRIWYGKLETLRNKEIELTKIISGIYINKGHNEQSMFEIMYIGNNRLRIKGESYWGVLNELGPNIGKLNFEVDLVDNKIVYSEKTENYFYRIILEFNGEEIVANEDNGIGPFGMNVFFSGVYNKVK